MLPIILSIFVVKYYFGYQSTVNPALAASFAFGISNLVMGALLTGLLVGKCTYLTYVFFRWAQTDLTTS